MKNKQNEKHQSIMTAFLNLFLTFQSLNLQFLGANVLFREHESLAQHKVKTIWLSQLDNRTFLLWFPWWCWIWFNHATSTSQVFSAKARLGTKSYIAFWSRDFTKKNPEMIWLISTITRDINNACYEKSHQTISAMILQVWREVPDNFYTKLISVPHG